MDCLHLHYTFPFNWLYGSGDTVPACIKQIKKEGFIKVGAAHVASACRQPFRREGSPLKWFLQAAPELQVGFPAWNSGTGFLDMMMSCPVTSLHRGILAPLGMAPKTPTEEA